MNGGTTPTPASTTRSGSTGRSASTTGSSSTCTRWSTPRAAASCAGPCTHATGTSASRSPRSCSSARWADSVLDPLLEQLGAALLPLLGGHGEAHVVLPHAVDLQVADGDAFVAQRQLLDHPPA